MSVGNERRFVYTDLLAMPDDGRRYEIVEGELIVSPSPRPKHQLIVGRLTGVLRELAAKGMGEVFPAPLDVVLDDRNVFEPDVLFVRTDRLSIVSDTNVQGPPDLVVEVLSEGTRDDDLGRKLSAYSRFGVAEYWVVDPDTQQVRLWRRAGAALLEGKVARRGDVIPFLGATIPVSDILG